MKAWNKQCLGNCWDGHRAWNILDEGQEVQITSSTGFTASHSGTFYDCDHLASAIGKDFC